MLAAAARFATADIVLLFAAAGIVLYVASRAAVDALTRANDPAPGRMALGHWIPIAWAALLPTLAGRSEVGVGIAFATSIAAVAMVLGILVCLAHGTNDDDDAAIARAAAPGGVVGGRTDDGGARLRASTWPFIVPAALLPLLAGFSGSLTWWHAAMLLLLGACVLSLWLARPPDAPFATPVAPAPSYAGAPQPSAQPDDAEPRTPTPVPRAPTRAAAARAVQFLLAVLLAAAGAWIAYKGTIAADERTRVATTGLIALAVISPLLVLPMLGSGAAASHHGRLASVTAAVIGVVLLNLLVLLPLVVLSHYARQVALGPSSDTSLAAAADASNATTMPSLLESLRPMPFPLAVWRVDTVLLLVLGLLLIPVSLGRITLRRAEGVALAVLYAAYLLASTALAVRA